jgi:hypothetical protein
MRVRGLCALTAGRPSTFCEKQGAQKAVKGIEGIAEIINDIEVTG